ncbi:hypothetical protein HMPREF3226_02681 [Prevotella corporis]|uniref:Uncharacterized protein n=1 Tax=Prevotella corporis TaxID=28128 RepID=A0A133PTM3_9BACT|nr:hypothetical protein HMPREF3226_02681 [Prevotella corporis]
MFNCRADGLSFFRKFSALSREGNGRQDASMRIQDFMKIRN